MREGVRQGTDGWNMRRGLRLGQFLFPARLRAKPALRTEGTAPGFSPQLVCFKRVWNSQKCLDILSSASMWGPGIPMGGEEMAAPGLGGYAVP